MSITPFVFDPVAGWEDSSVFPTTRDNEELVRADLQRLHTQTRNYINNTLAPQVESALADQKTELEAEIAAVSQGAVPDNTITAAKLTADSVTTPKIAGGAVTTPKIADDAVTKAKLSETLAAEIDGKLDAPVGTIVESVRTDLGEKWALCNGDFNDLTDPTEKAALDAVLKANDIPKPNPEGGTYAYLHEMYNGEWESHFSEVVIVGTDGKKKYEVAFSSLPDYESGRKCFGIEHDGTSYVVFTTAPGESNTKFKVYKTTDFSTYTTPQEITVAAGVINYSSNGSFVIYNGHQYYVVVGEYVKVLSESNSTFLELTTKAFNLRPNSSDTSAGSLFVVSTGTEHIVFHGQAYLAYSDDGFASMLRYFDADGTPHQVWDFTHSVDGTSYYTTWGDGQPPRLGVVLNDTHLLLWQTSGGRYYNGSWWTENLKGVKIKRSDMTSDGSVTFSTNNAPLWAGISADGNYFNLYYIKPVSSYNGYTSYWAYVARDSIKTDDNLPSQPSILIDKAYGQFDNLGLFYPRSREGIIPTGTKLIRAKLLPLLPSDECYSYIKVKE